MAYFVLKLKQKDRAHRTIECYRRDSGIKPRDQFLWASDIYGDDETPIHVEIDGGTSVLPNDEGTGLLVRID